MQVYKEKADCCGCTACKNICPTKAITMQVDEEGFLYPVIDESKCIQCGACQKICAFQRGYSIQHRLEKPLVYAAKSKEIATRMASSSGGIFTELAHDILKQNGILYGVKFNEKFDAIHTSVQTEEELKACRGSKYVQSNLQDIFQMVKNDLKGQRKVLFSGTPCQVAGLNRFLGNIDKQNLLLVDIVCHGTPSNQLFKEYVAFCEEKKQSKMVAYYNRDKSRGWGHNEKAVYANKKTDDKSVLSQAWKNIFYTNLALRPCCYNCQYTNTQRPSDITLADFWGIHQSNPEFADKKGVSLVMVNTTKGKEIFENIQARIETIQKTVEEASVKNPQLKHPIEKNPTQREKFWKVYREEGFTSILKKYGKYTMTFKIKNITTRLKYKIKEILKK